MYFKFQHKLHLQGVIHLWNPQNSDPFFLWKCKQTCNSQLFQNCRVSEQKLLKATCSVFIIEPKIDYKSFRMEAVR